MTRLTGGVWNRHTIEVPPGSHTRPTMARVRQSVMARLLPRLGGARVLDVFAGSGVMGFEALSRGAACVRACERDASAARLIAENARHLNLSPAQYLVTPGDALRLLRHPPDAPFDLIYLDPPYGYDRWASVLALIAAHGWLAHDGWLLAEHRRSDALPLAPPWQVHAVWMYGDTRVSVLETAPASPIIEAEPSPMACPKTPESEAL